MNSARRRRAHFAIANACTLALGLPFAGAQAIPAFPGADGAGASATGGRGGIVYHVTKLNSAIDDPARNDPGTIRYGLNSANFPANTPRTIVFDVSGVFNLSRLPQPNQTPPWDPNGNGWDAQSRLTIGGNNVTIAGQTAPGPVIFMGGGLKPQGNSNIVRNVTVASGYGTTGWWKPGNPYPGVPGAAGTTTDPTQWFPDNIVYDAMEIDGTNIMVDHVSTLFGTDETVSMNEVANNVTVQYSNISQALNYPQADAENNGSLTGHALGSLLEAGGSTTQAAISFHHDLYAHLKGRVPQMQAGGAGAYYDFRNNVFYNWFGTAGSKSGATFLNLANNFYLAGPGGDSPVGGTSPNIVTAAGGTSVIGTTSSIYRNGNLLDSNKDGDANDGVLLSNSGGAANPLWMNGAQTYNGVTDSAATAYSRVLNYMGANWWTRDGVINTPDERIINETRTGTGKIIAWADDPWNNSDGAEWQAVKNTPQVSRDANWDTDGDGMPDWWEIAHGLDPNNADNNGDFDADGYTNLEEYLNEVAEWPAPGPIVFDGATNNRYAQITNWDSNPDPTSKLPWQPSKYDVAVINSGTVVVDSVGQHAGTLQIGNGATLSVTAGWIDVATATTVAAGGNVNVSGGLANVGALSGGGSVAVSGGMIEATSIRVTNLNISSGAAQVTPDGTAAGVSKIVNLAVTGGVLDLTNNGLVVASAGAVGSWNGSAYTGVTASIASGRNGGNWSGSGIITTQSDAANATYTTLGVATASEVLGIAQTATATWRGQIVSGTDALVMYTYGGDATLDGKINIDDYIRADAGFAGGLSGWSNGDFNYDGKVNIDDYTTIIDPNFVNQGPQLGGSGSIESGAAGVTAIPEPSALGLVAMAALAVNRRRRNCDRK